jgi:plasmid stabilization system protein ParE
MSAARRWQVAQALALIEAAERELERLARLLGDGAPDAVLGDARTALADARALAGRVRQLRRAVECQG